MKNHNEIQKAASEQMSNEIVTSNNNEILMKKENTKSAGISRPAANMANIGNDMEKQSIDYLNEKVDTMIYGVPYPFQVCRWMMNIAVHCGTKAQKTAFARLTCIGYNWDNFKGYAVRLMFAPEEPELLKKDLHHIKKLIKSVRNSDEPFAEPFIVRMNELVDGFTGLLNDCAGKNRSVA